MFGDEDIKIVDRQPSETVERFQERETKQKKDLTLDPDEVRRGRELGRRAAGAFIRAAQEPMAVDEDSDADMLLQRRLLLSFTVSVALERFCRDDSIAGIAQKSFLDALKKTSDALYHSSSDTGAFSFYYLAFRRGGDVERRIGQTFAMLCSHDGDPIYQELGEALYCWFSSVVLEDARALNLCDPALNEAPQTGADRAEPGQKG